MLLTKCSGLVFLAGCLPFIKVRQGDVLRKANASKNRLWRRQHVSELLEWQRFICSKFNNFFAVEAMWPVGHERKSPVYKAAKVKGDWYSTHGPCAKQGPLEGI